MKYPFDVPSKIKAPGNNFRQQYESLDKKIQKKVDKLFKEFESGEIKPGRKIKPYSGCENCFEARVDLKFRFIYMLDLPNGIPIAVGSHEQVETKSKDSQKP